MGWNVYAIADLHSARFCATSRRRPLTRRSSLITCSHLFFLHAQINSGDFDTLYQVLTWYLDKLWVPHLKICLSMWRHTSKESWTSHYDGVFVSLQSSLARFHCHAASHCQHRWHKALLLLSVVLCYYPKLISSNKNWWVFSFFFRFSWYHIACQETARNLHFLSVKMEQIRGLVKKSHL